MTGGDFDKAIAEYRRLLERLALASRLAGAMIPFKPELLGGGVRKKDRPEAIEPPGPRPSPLAGRTIAETLLGAAK